MTLGDFQQWLERYGEAWVQGDSDAVVGLFSDDCLYFEKPFDAPMVGREAVHQYWSEGAKNSQEDVTFQASPITLQASTGFAKWQATFKRLPRNSFVELEGILEARFNEEGLCIEFREWWHRRESEG